MNNDTTNNKTDFFSSKNIFLLVTMYLFFTIPILANDFYPLNLEPTNGSEFNLGSTVPIRFDVCLGYDYPAAAGEWRVEISIYYNNSRVYFETILGFDANGPACYPITDAPAFIPSSGGTYYLEIKTFYDQEINTENDFLTTEFVVKSVRRDLALVSIISPQPMAEYFSKLDYKYKILVRNEGDNTIYAEEYSIFVPISTGEDQFVDRYFITTDIQPGVEEEFETPTYSFYDDARFTLSDLNRPLNYSIEIKFSEDDNLSNNILDGNTITFLTNPIWPNEFRFGDGLSKSSNNFADNDFVEFVVTDKFSDPELYKFIVYDSSGVQIDSTTLDLFTVGETVDSFTVYSHEYSGDVLPDHGAMALTYDSLRFTDYFISWGGPITAAEGIWKDSTSTDVGITPAAGKSISLVGQGTDFSSFTWENSTPTPGSFNDSQLVPVEENQVLDSKFTLEQNYPNPFNPTTTIRYSIPNVASDFSLSNVQLKLYDVLGREVKTLVNKIQSPGNYEVTLNASDLSSGVYYYQIKMGNFIETRKMSLLK